MDLQTLFPIVEFILVEDSDLHILIQYFIGLLIIGFDTDKDVDQPVTAVDRLGELAIVLFEETILYRRAL